MYDVDMLDSSFRIIFCHGEKPNQLDESIKVAWLRKLRFASQSPVVDVLGFL